MHQCASRVLDDEVALQQRRSLSPSPGRAKRSSSGDRVSSLDMPFSISSVILSSASHAAKGGLWRGNGRRDILLKAAQEKEYTSSSVDDADSHSQNLRYKDIAAQRTAIIFDNCQEYFQMFAPN
ncbi:hypothetical protein FQN53_001514 [Emmonsiellopsis sp. PD_33]|nr:hypothetical protein FQN53_001514 [Emmonsiellopsis sp. PD_33]